MDSKFSELYASSSLIRKQYSGLFGIPHNFQFTKDTLLLEYEGTLYSVAASDFHHGTTKWRKISSAKPKLNTRSAQLLQERMRQSGIIKMSEVLPDRQTILLHGSSPQLQRLNGEIISTFPKCEGGLGIQICPSNYKLVACVLDGDLFLLHSSTGNVHQLTFTKDVPNLSAGFPPYIIQEEFDRYVGFLWKETNSDHCTNAVYKILYEEVTTEGLEVLHTFNPLVHSVEDYPYPRPGKMNANSVLKLLELTFHGVDEQLSVKERSLSVSFHELFPDCCEYLVRFGWMPGEEAVWIQLLNRQQTHLMLVVVTTDSFDSQGYPYIYVLWEERSSFWISVSDCLEFISVEKSLIRFVWLSECSGHNHLYLVEAKPPDQHTCGSSAVHYATHSSRVITHGEWNVLNSKIWVNRESQLVYFQANKLSPVSNNLYCTSLFEDCEPRQITTSGFYHNVTLDTMNFKYFLTVFSNATSSINMAIHSLAEPYTKIAEWCGPDIPSSYTAPTTFNVTTETGEELYGAIYPPENLKDGTKVPTMLYVYGGPGVQLVTCALSRQLPRIQLWRKHGYAVIMLDNRGSANRGVHFASFVKGQMGLIETRDQVLGLKEASGKVDFIDMSRVGIMGWSYGGYLALMALCEYPDLFKVCVAGAPVTDWFYYDSAYTERYLGVPHDSDDDAYVKSSLLKKASNFPSESGRLLIIHGLGDENVLFTHTAKLCNELVSYGKPYIIQIYPGERHGLKSQNNVLHCDATILQFLNNNL